METGKGKHGENKGWGIGKTGKGVGRERGIKEFGRGDLKTTPVKYTLKLFPNRLL